MGFYRGPNIVRDGLVLYLDAANQKSYSGTGTTWNDLSGRGNNGTLINGPTFNSGNGGSIYIDGTNDSIEFDSPINTNSPFTLDFWYYPTRINTSYDMLYSGVDNTDIQLFFHSISKLLTTSIENVEVSTNFMLDATTINKWYNITWTYNYSVRNVYINSERVLSSASTTIFTKNNTKSRIGSTTGNSLYLQGKIGSSKIYNKALTADEVLQNYNATKSRYGL